MAEAKVIIKSENNISKGLNSAKKDLTGFESSVQSISKKLETAFTFTAIIAGVKKLADAAKQCINEYAEAEKVSMRLEKVWENVGVTTKKSYSDIMRYADALEKSTYFTSEAVEESALLLAATESLNKDGFEKALDLSADLAAALGEDMTSAASTLAKALEDPASALTRLKTIGVTFTEDEKAQITALTDANEAYKAQEIILGKIESKYKDVAKAINNTPAGKLDNIRDVLGDIRENLGRALLDSISPALDTLYTKLLQISNWIAENTDSKANEIKTKVVNAAKKGNVLGADLSEYSVNDLLKAYDSAKYNYENPVKVFGQDTWALSHYAFINVQRAVQEELRKRGYEGGVSGARSNNYGPTSTNSVEQTVTETIAPVIDLLNKYGSSSESYIRESYQSVIDQSQAILDTIEAYSGNFYDDNGVPRLFYGEIKDALGLPKDTTGDQIANIYIQLREIIDTFTGKLAALDEVEEEKKENPFDAVLSKYGSLSKAFQIDEIKNEINRLSYLRVEADDVTGHYLDQIIGSLFDQLDELTEIKKEIPEPQTFIDDLKDVFGKWISNLDITAIGQKLGLNIDSEQGAAAAGALIDTAISNMGEAGEVAGRLAQNMMVMGPALGAIVTALQYVIEGFMEVMGPVLQDFVKYGIEPLREIGRVIADILMPIMEDIMPSIKQSAEFLIGIFDLIGMVLKPIVSFLSSFLTPILETIISILQILEEPLKIVAKGLSAVGETLSWLGDWIRHIVASVVNWLGSINIAGWYPFGGLHMNDVDPGDLFERVEKRWSDIDNAFTMGDTSGTSTQAAAQNASYSGATSVTINIYQEAPVVGEGGMLEFAQMIRSQFEALDYYGV